MTEYSDPVDALDAFSRTRGSKAVIIHDGVTWGLYPAGHPDTIRLAEYKHLMQRYWTAKQAKRIADERHLNHPSSATHIIVAGLDERVASLVNTLAKWQHDVVQEDA